MPTSVCTCSSTEVWGAADNHCIKSLISVSRLRDLNWGKKAIKEDSH